MSSTTPTTTTARYRVTLYYDPWGECPCHGWDALYQLVSGKRNSAHGVGNNLALGISEGEFSEATVAYVLNVYEHSGIHYYLAGERGPIDPGGWDTAEGGAVLIVKSMFLDEFKGLDDEARLSLARGFLDTFNAWANGEVYAFDVERLERCELDEVHAVESIGGYGGFYGMSVRDSGLLESIADALPAGTTADQIQVTGEASYLVDPDDIAGELIRPQKGETK